MDCKYTNCFRNRNYIFYKFATFALTNLGADDRAAKLRFAKKNQSCKKWM